MANTLNNNQIEDIIKSAHAQVTGAENIDDIDLADVIEMGSSDNPHYKETFTGALEALIAKTYYTVTKDESGTIDPYFEDSDRFKQVVRFLSIDIPDVKENSAWQSFGNGEGQVSKIGTYDIFKPIVYARYYCHSDSWALPMTLTGEQWDVAFSNEAELSAFVGMLWYAFDEKAQMHRKEMSYLNRNNFIASKLASQAADLTGLKLHAVNLVQLYVDKYGLADEGCTVDKFLTTQQALADGVRNIGLYRDYFKSPNKTFNNSPIPVACSESDMVLELISEFDSEINTVLNANTYHDEFVKLGSYNRVPFWQGVAKEDANEDIQKYDFDTVTTINVKTADGDTINKSGIIGLLVDKKAIMHTIKSERTPVKYFEIEDMTQIEYQARDQYMNNLDRNGIVFYLEDVAAVESDDNEEVVGD